MFVITRFIEQFTWNPIQTETFNLLDSKNNAKTHLYNRSGNWKKGKQYRFWYNLAILLELSVPSHFKPLRVPSEWLPQIGRLYRWKRIIEGESINLMHVSMWNTLRFDSIQWLRILSYITYQKKPQSSLLDECYVFRF